MESIFSPDGLSSIGKIYRAKFKLPDVHTPREGDDRVSSEPVVKVLWTDKSGDEVSPTPIPVAPPITSLPVIEFSVNPSELRPDKHLLVTGDGIKQSRH